MTTWSHLERLFTASPELLEIARLAAQALLLAGAGVFIAGLARLLDSYRPK